MAISYSFTAVDAPGALAETTMAAVIDAAGHVAGTYYDGSLTRSFLYSGGSSGTYTILNDPNAALNYSTRINAVAPNGDLAGYYYEDGSDIAQGFVYNIASGTYSPIENSAAAGNVPIQTDTSSFVTTGGNAAMNASDQVIARSLNSPLAFLLYSGGISGTTSIVQGPDPAGSVDALFGINDAGEVLGSYTTSLGSGGPGVDHGFIYNSRDQTYILLNDPQAGPSQYTIGTTMNAAGDVAGIFQDVTGQVTGFLYSGGTYTTLIPDPTAISPVPMFLPPTSSRVYAAGVDAAGEVAGLYYDNNWSAHSFLYSGGTNGTYTILNYPGAAGPNVVIGITNAGEVFGSFYDADGNSHLFAYSGGANGTYSLLHDPDAAPGTETISGFNDAGEIIGQYNDLNGVAHAFIASPQAQTPISGTVSDGYIAGATIFADANRDGVLGNGEQSAVTDSAGHFTLAGGSGPLVAFGGTDTSTGLGFRGTLVAPSGYTAVTPLSTLVGAIAAQGGTVAAAEQAVLNAFNIHLAAGQSLSNLDPVAGTQSGDPAATAAFVAGAEVLDTATMLSSALSGETGSSYQAAFSAVLNSLAGQVTSLPSGTQLDLSSSAVISSTVQSAAATLSSTPLNPVLVNTITTQTVTQNTAVLQASSSGGNVLAAVSTVATTAQGSASANLQHIAQDTTPPIPAVTNIIIDSRTDLALITGTSEAGSVVSVFDLGRQVGTTTTGSNGTWSIETNAPGNTIHSYTETATDLAGNVGSSAGAALYAPAAKKTMIGTSGDDVLIGRPNDVLTGGAGNDTFVFNGSFGRETITDFHPATVDSHGVVTAAGDLIELSQTPFSTFAAVQSHTQQAGANTLISVSPADTITLNNVQLTALHAADFRFL